jgi:hypothetical protein
MQTHSAEYLPSIGREKGEKIIAKQGEKMRKKICWYHNGVGPLAKMRFI